VIARDKALFALIVLCFLTYANCLNNAFISDDIPAILENPQITQASRYWLEPSGLLNSFCFKLFKVNPVPYRLVNILLHCLNSLLVFFFLRLYFGTAGSFWGAAIFAVHPAHVEAVAWISGRPYLILAFFILITYLLYQRATEKEKFKPLSYAIALLLFSYYIISSYSFFALFPLLLILSDVTFQKWRRNWKFWVPFFAILIFRLLLGKHSIAGRITQVGEDLGAPLSYNPLVYLTYVFYSHLRVLIWPLRLTFYYDPAVLSQDLLRFYPLYLLPIALLLVFAFKKERRLFFALGVFILLLAPAYSPIPVTSLVTERYLYFPVLSVSMLAAFVLEKSSAGKAKFRLLILAFLSALIILFSWRAIIRNGDWKDQVIFWRRTLAASPKSSRAHNNMGLIYLKQGDTESAFSEFSQAIALNPREVDAYINLGLAYEKSGRQDEAISLFQAAIRLKPQYGFSYYNLANVYKRINKTEQAAAFYRLALEKNPALLKAYNNLANLYITQGKYAQAVYLLEEAIKLNPHYAAAYLNLSIANFYLKDYARAVAYCDQARRLGLEVPPGYRESLEVYR